MTTNNSSNFSADVSAYKGGRKMKKMKTKTVDLQALKHKKPSKGVMKAKKDDPRMSRKERERRLEKEPM